MAKTNYKYEKRQKDLAKKKKQDEKRQKKLNKNVEEGLDNQENPSEETGSQDDAEPENSV